MTSSPGDQRRAPTSGTNTLVAEDLLAPGEAALGVVIAPNRRIFITSYRLIIVEDDGDWATIPVNHITGVEVRNREYGWIVKVFFGGGLSRTVKVNDLSDAKLIASASVGPR